ncbi:MAG: hypothetical protein AAF519_14410 [Bacteroidota bacterium]
MTVKAKTKIHDILLVLGISLTLILSGFCWSKVLLKETDLQVTGIQTSKSVSSTGKKVVFLGGIFFGITKYLRSN